MSLMNIDVDDLFWQQPIRSKKVFKIDKVITLCLRQNLSRCVKRSSHDAAADLLKVAAVMSCCHMKQLTAHGRSKTI
jgi:hypothetical protein